MATATRSPARLLCESHPTGCVLGAQGGGGSRPRTRGRARTSLRHARRPPRLSTREAPAVSRCDPATLRPRWKVSAGVAMCLPPLGDQGHPSRWRGGRRGRGDPGLLFQPHPSPPGTRQTQTSPALSLTRVRENRGAPGRTIRALSCPRGRLLLQLAAVEAEARHHAPARRAHHARLLEALAAHRAHGARAAERGRLRDLERSHACTPSLHPGHPRCSPTCWEPSARGDLTAGRGGDGGGLHGWHSSTEGHRWREKHFGGLTPGLGEQSEQAALLSTARRARRGARAAG